MSAKRKSLWNDQSGAAMLEFTAAAFTFLMILLGVVEFSNLFFQRNAAEKAVQYGARQAAVSDPVYTAADLNFTRTVSGYLPGEELPAGAFDIVCSGVSASCTCSGSVCPTGGVGYSVAKMREIAYGRGNVTSTCVNVQPNAGMCNFFPRVGAQNIRVEYRFTGLGYVGRPGGPVPTVTVSIINMTYDFVLIGGLANLNSIPVTSAATTMTGEDLSTTWSG